MWGANKFNALRHRAVTLWLCDLKRMIQHDPTPVETKQNSDCFAALFGFTLWWTNTAMENHHLYCKNPLFLWPFSIAFCMFTRGYLVFNPSCQIQWSIIFQWVCIEGLGCTIALGHCRVPQLSVPTLACWGVLESLRSACWPGNLQEESAWMKHGWHETHATGALAPSFVWGWKALHPHWLCPADLCWPVMDNVSWILLLVCVQWLQWLFTHHCWAVKSAATIPSF